MSGRIHGHIEKFSLYNRHIYIAVIFYQSVKWCFTGDKKLDNTKTTERLKIDMYIMKTIVKQ